ncbi:MAG: hypothetical protein J2P37_08680, partial [Ktedonobacteraceae bacterium]|nr:hypothetical protein [Ktedonobacteraceae bacterium]
MAALLSYRNKEVRGQFLQIYERGARRSLHPEIATRSAPAAALGTGIGMIVFSCLTLLPLPRGLQLFPPLWLPIFGAGIGYVCAWKITQRRALLHARRQGQLQADLTMRQARHYLQWYHFLTPWLLVLTWTVILCLQLGPYIGQPLTGINSQQSAIVLNWFDVLSASGMGLLLALIGWFLLRNVVQAPRVLPSQDIELAALTEHAMRQEAVRHVHIGTLGSLTLLLLGPTFIIPNMWLRLGLVLLLFLITFG